MSSECDLVFPSSKKGNNRCIELAGLDLWIIPRIDNVFVYSSEINIENFKNALGYTLTLWPLVTGRFLGVENDRYFIKMSDNGIPVTVIENTELKKWPLDDNVVVDINKNTLLPFIDGVQTMKLMATSNDEPLVRLQLTHIKESGEWVLGTSWAHLLGDAESNLNFLSTLSRFYHHLEPIQPHPIFERRLWREDEADDSLLPFMKEIQHAKSAQEAFQSFFGNDETHEQLNLHFSYEELERLRELAGGNTVTRQDALTSYIILLLNTHCFKDNDEQRILRTNTAINFRGVSDAIAPANLVSNAVLVISSDVFDDPLSLSSIARTIRQSIIRTRDPQFLEPCVATVDKYLRRFVREKRMHNLGPFPNSITVNSNLRYDWAELVNLGSDNRCRFYTLWTGQYYLRVFRLNRDYHGAEVAFRIAKNIKDIFLSALEKDLTENFSNVRL